LDEEIEEIRRLMLRSVEETVSEDKMSRRRPVISAGKMQQQHRSNGADGHLQRTIWDTGGFQQRCWEAHEKDLMIFAAEEYDVGASLHVIKHQPTNMHSMERRGATLSLSNFKFEFNVLNVCKAGRAKPGL
jgi:hypothetical protein